MGEQIDGPNMGVSGTSLKNRGQRVADHFSNQLPKSHLRAHIGLSEDRDVTVIPQPHSCMGLVCMYQTWQMMTKCICWTQQGHCTHDHTVTRTTYVKSCPWPCQPKSQHAWGGANENSPLPEELLAVNDCWGRENQFYLNDTWEAQCCSRLSCTRAHAGITKWTQ